MSFRPLTVLVSACAALALTTIAAQPAQAADAVTCTITGTSPAVIIQGIAPQQVQFGVQTDCAGKHPVSWDLGSDIYPGSSGASWLLLRNYDHPGGEKFTVVEDPQGYFTVNFNGGGAFQGNGMTGAHPLNVRAFVDSNGDGLANGDEPVTSYAGTFVAKRASTFGDSFAAALSGRPRHQKIEFTGSLQRANWDSAQYEHLGAWVQLQFRPAGESRYRTVKRVRDDGTSATTSVRATRSGSWRYHYRGDDITGPSNSTSVTVVVPRR